VGALDYSFSLLEPPGKNGRPQKSKSFSFFFRQCLILFDLRAASSLGIFLTVIHLPKLRVALCLARPWFISRTLSNPLARKNLMF